MKCTKLFINGEWINSEKQFCTVNPSTGEEFAEIYCASADTVGQAVEAAKTALSQWKQIPINERAAIVGNASKILIEKYGSEGEMTPLKQLIMDEVGKPLPEADIEVIESSDMLSYFVENVPNQLQPKELNFNKELWPTKKGTVVFEPKGVIAVIKAWNYPLEIPIWSIGPALIAGNTIVFKPSEYSSVVAQEIVSIFEKAGLPKGVLNLVLGGADVGRTLVKHKDIDMVDFTGSVDAGKEIATECGATLKSYSLELGGNDAAIVLADADIELAANGLIWGAFCNAGQVCVGVKRAFIEEPIFDNISKVIIDKVNHLRHGIDYGPVISKKQLEKIENFVSDAVNKGAVVLSGGKRIDSSKGYFYSPTVLGDVDLTMKIMNEECFGPVLPITSIKSIKDGISKANNSDYGLGASIWTSKNDKGLELAAELETGMVWINDVNVAYPEAPWGGIKQSGHGIALSEWAIMEYVNKKHINSEMSNESRRAWWYPYA